MEKTRTDGPYSTGVPLEPSIHNFQWFTSRIKSLIDVSLPMSLYSHGNFLVLI